MSSSLTTAFSSLGSRNYRLFFGGQLVSVCGTWMQTVAQAFLVLHLTNSGTALGATTAVRFAPMFLLSPLGGVVADRLDKRRLLYVTQAAAGVLALAFGVLVSIGAMRLWVVFLLAAGLGVVNAFDNPGRQTFIAELVGPDLLPNAVVLNSITVNMSRIFGGAIGGAIVAGAGLATCFDLNALSFLVVIATLWLMHDAELLPAPPARREAGQIRAGLRYVRSTPELLVPLLMVAVVGTFAWEFQITLPLLAERTFAGGAGTYGTMTAVMGAGAVVGGLVAAIRARPGGTALATAAVGWGVSITAAALAPSIVDEYVVLLFVGYGSITFNSYAKTRLQLDCEPSMRGRVMALWALAWLGSTPIGGPIVGWIGEVAGPRWSLLAGGIPTVAVGLACYPLFRRLSGPR